MTRSAPPRFSLRGMSPACAALFTVVLALGTAALVLSLVTVRPTGHDLWLGALLLLLATVSGAVAGRLRPAEEDHGYYISIDSCWLIPVALLLPLPLVVPLAFVLHLLAALTQERKRFDVKLLYSQCCVGLAAGAAALVGRALLPQPFGTDLMSSDAAVAGGLVAVLVTYYLLNQASIRVAALALSRGPRRLTLAQAAGRPAEHGVEVALLCLGALLALLLSRNPLLALVALPIPLAMHPVLGLDVLRTRADRDVKTGLMSVSAWTAEAGRAVARAAYDGSPVAVLLLDLDHFKAVNDGHGHLVGDAVLRAAADVLRAELRPGSLLGRFGGEEFVALLPGAATPDATRAAERLRAALEAAPLQVGDLTVHLTVSVGVCVGASGASLDALLSGADRGMYAAKSLGRNQVHVDALDTPPSVTGSQP